MVLLEGSLEVEYNNFLERVLLNLGLNLGLTGEGRTTEFNFNSFIDTLLLSHEQSNSTIFSKGVLIFI